MDFTAQATGRVVTNGNINLVGRTGICTRSGANCNQCGGEPGGDVRITTEEISIA